MAARKENTLIFLTIIGCCISIIISGVAFGTNDWFETEVFTSTQQLLRATANFGLFSGFKTKLGVETKEYDLKVVCLKSKCMYSCGIDGDRRKSDIQNLIDGGPEMDLLFCSDEIGETPPVNPSYERKFLSFGIWICTLVFLLASIAFATLSGVQALYNTFRSPSLSIFSVFGLYFWNGFAAIFNLLTLIVWGVGFATNLKKDSAISETLYGGYSSENKDGYARLGYSYWILLAPFFLHAINIALIYYRSWRIRKMNEKNVKVIKEVVTSGETLLF